MTEWYEVAVSYKDDHGTETIATFDTLKKAKEYAKNHNDLSESFMELWEEVDFIFIDRWYYDKDKYGEHNQKYDEPAVFIYKETK